MSYSYPDKHSSLEDSPNSLDSLMPTSSLSTNFNSKLSLAPPSTSSSSSFSSSSDPSTTNSDEQSSIILSSPLSQRPRPPTSSLERSVTALEAEYGVLITLYDKIPIKQPPVGHHRTQRAQKTMRDPGQQQEQQLESNKKAKEREPWGQMEQRMRETDERQADIGAVMLREWLAAGKPRGRVTESMRHRQRDEVAMLASRFGVYHGWAGNRYGLPGEVSEMSDPAWQASGKPRGWTGW